MNWERAKLKYVTRFAYGDAFWADEIQDGPIQVFGSNGPYASISHANTRGPAIIVGRKGSYGKVNWSAGPCFASDTTFFIDSSTTQHHLRWVFWLLQTLRLDEGSNETAIPGLNRDAAYAMEVAVPPQQHQRAIADYLDRETAQIDALVAAKDRLLVLLAEKRRALITAAVTRGLDPSARLRDSGVVWLGQVPAHWKIAGFTKYLRSLVDYRGRTPEKVSSGVFLVTARNIKDGYIDYEASQEFVDADAYDEVMQRGKPEIGDLLLTTEAPLGQAALVDREDIALAQRVIKLDYDPEVLLNEFALAWIRSAPFQWQLNSFATGSTALGIKGERLHMLHNLLPPVDEQRAIVAHIAAETARLDALAAAAARSIALLKERRAALIAAAVTGQIEIQVDVDTKATN